VTLEDITDAEVAESTETVSSQSALKGRDAQRDVTRLGDGGLGSRRAR
jgi:hypothetical protein